MHMPNLARLPRPRAPKPLVVGPKDHGRRMSLEDFARAEGAPGHIYELARGVIQVSKIPKIDHGLMRQEIADRLTAYRLSHRGAIFYIASGSDCALRLPGMQSERHPDVAAYFTPPPPPTVKETWSRWIPEIVVEIVSERSKHRDYHEKREEYLAAGVREYWIFDRAAGHATLLVREGDIWVESTVARRLATALLPGFALDVRKVFAAPRVVEE